MPVMELSAMMTVAGEALYVILISPVRPEWMNVESPITATVCLAHSGRALMRPWSIEIDAPMSMVVSIAESGAAAPSV